MLTAGDKQIKFTDSQSIGFAQGEQREKPNKRFVGSVC
jgi:hypothetical protein